jgi:hypothetical protein
MPSVTENVGQLSERPELDGARYQGKQVAPDHGEADPQSINAGRCNGWAGRFSLDAMLAKR